MLLRYVEEATLKKATREKQDNGTYIETLTDIAVFKVQRKELNDEVSANIYGADITKMIKVRSIRQELESYLMNKINNTTDNISYYYIYLQNKKYKIKSANKSGVDLELV